MSDNNLTRAEAIGRARLISGVSYDVVLDLPADGGTFTSDTTVRFACSSPGASSFVDLVAHDVESIELNGSRVGVDGFDGSRIGLDRLGSANELRVVARCDYMRTGAGLHHFVDPVDGLPYLHTQLEPFDAHRVLACFDQPDLKAPLALTVRAPSDWVVVSNEPRTNDEDGVHHFAATPRLSTYLYAVVAGPYESVHATHRDVPLGLYCRRSLAGHLDAEELFDVTRRGLDFFGDLYGYPYPFAKYDQLFVPEFSAGAMENAGCVTFNESYVFRSRVTEAQLEGRANTILHEMAHMWFGDLVTMRWWDDLWLNESFATYMATAAIVGATRFAGGWSRFAGGTKAAAYAQDQLPSTHPISADIVDTDATETHFDAITYQKGASVLRQLVAWAGEDAFRDGVRAYFRSHEWDNASLADFLHALEATSGRDLRAWSREWLETSGVNTLRTVIEVDASAYRSVAIAQAGDTLRSHRLAVGLYGLSDGVLMRRRRVELDVSGASTPVDELTGEAVADLLLVNDDDLTYSKTPLDERSLDTVVAHLSHLEDPLARTLCWAATWEMVRDAQLPAARYVDLVTAHVQCESDLGAVGRLLGQVDTAADLYGDPARRGEYRRAIAARARTQLDASEAGSDAQLTWARAWIAHDDSEEGVSFARDLLAGQRLPGLAVDTDLRWHVVSSLCAGGFADDGLADAELERDPTDIGRRRALAAKASMPDEAAKTWAWQRLVDDRSAPLATLRAVAAAFHQPAQDDLLRPYVDRYLAALPTIWQSRDRDEALALTRGLYPSTLVGADVAHATARALDGLELPASARRVLTEGKDRIERALRARSVDAAD